MLHWEMRAGYGAKVYNDGDELSLDLCQHCVKTLLGNIVVNHGNAYFPDSDEEAKHFQEY
jgi:hypothetical protein